MKNIFTPEVSAEIIARINKLTPATTPAWGKMNVGQMLAHCNVTYAFTYTPEQFKKPNFFMRFILKNFIKKIVVGEKPYGKNGRTAPEFLITDSREFEKEKALLIANIQKTQQLGAAHFEGKENFSFGTMTAQEWNALFYKHLDHHLSQFGV
jgi:Protein of unknown function (DUF1569)